MLAGTLPGLPRLDGDAGFQSGHNIHHRTSILINIGGVATFSMALSPASASHITEGLTAG